MIERMGIDPLLHCIAPLLVRDRDVSNWPPDRAPEGFNHPSYCWGFADERVNALGRGTKISQQSCTYTGNIFRADEGDNGRILSPRHEDGALLGDAPADKSAYVLIVGRRLEVNSSHLRPIKYAIGQPVLQVAEAGSVLQMAKSRIAARTLKL